MSNKSLKFLLLLYGLLFAGPLYSQPIGRDIVTQPTEWFGVNSHLKFNRKLGFTFDGQLRFVGNLENYQHYLRGGLEIYVTPDFSVIPLGYLYLWNFQYGKQPAMYGNNEQRIWQGVQYRHSLGKLTISHRLRIEQRFFQQHHTEPDGDVVYDGYDAYANRARYRIQLLYPLRGRKVEPGTWFVMGFDEVFFSWGDGITFDKPDQNRIYAGLGYQFSKQFNIQGGPLYQMLIKKNGAQQENNVGTLIQVTYNLDFSRHD